AVMTPLVVGVTSHRDIPAHEVESIRQRVRDFFGRLQSDFPRLPLVVMSALAEGGDQLVAQEALAMGVQLVAPLPLRRDLYAEDFKDPAVHAGFEALCAQARVIELSNFSRGMLDEVGLQGPQRDRQYGQAGVFIARHCHLLLAIWDGKSSDRLGGTAQVVDYFLSGVMPGLIDRRQGARRFQFGASDERLVCQIVCSRAQSDGAPASPLQPGQCVWRTSEHTSPVDAPMPVDFRTMFQHMAEFNDDCRTYRAEMEHHDREPIAGTAPACAIDRLFLAADWLAVHFQKRVLLAMRMIYTLAAVMGVAFNIYDNVPDQDEMIYVFLLLFASGAVLSMIARRRSWHRKYLDYRALAEGLRVQGYWRRVGIALNDDPEFAQDSYLQKQDIELGWTRNVMRAAGLQSMDTTLRGSAQDLREVIRDWVGDATHAGQLDYYTCKAAQRARRHRFTEAVGMASLCIGIGISVLLAVLAHRLSADAKNILVIVMAVFSIVAAVREAYAYRKADKELIKQYRFMQRIFTRARAALDRAAEVAEQRDILLALGDAALTEHAEWTLMQRERQVEHSKF
ncbi:MAG: hypothetical protein ABI870_01480, partial [Rhodanobacter sp.]